MARKKLDSSTFVGGKVSAQALILYAGVIREQPKFCIIKVFVGTCLRNSFPVAAFRGANRTAEAMEMEFEIDWLVKKGSCCDTL